MIPLSLSLSISPSFSLSISPSLSIFCFHECRRHRRRRTTAGSRKLLREGRRWSPMQSPRAVARAESSRRCSRLRPPSNLRTQPPSTPRLRRTFEPSRQPSDLVFLLGFVGYLMGFVGFLLGICCIFWWVFYVFFDVFVVFWCWYNNEFFVLDVDDEIHMLLYFWVFQCRGESVFLGFSMYRWIHERMIHGTILGFWILVGIRGLCFKFFLVQTKMVLLWQKKKKKWTPWQLLKKNKNGSLWCLWQLLKLNYVFAEMAQQHVFDVLIFLFNFWQIWQLCFIQNLGIHGGFETEKKKRRREEEREK